MDRDANVVEGFWVVGAAFTDADEVGDVVFFEDGEVGWEGGVRWAVEDQEVERPDLNRADADSRHCESVVKMFL